MTRALALLVALSACDVVTEPRADLIPAPDGVNVYDLRDYLETQGHDNCKAVQIGPQLYGGCYDN